MILAPLLIGAALATVPYAPPGPPLWTDWALRAELSAGGDAWTGGGGAAMEGALSGWWGQPFRKWRTFAGYSGLLESIPASPGTTWDAHAVDFGVESNQKARVGLSAHLRGATSGVPPWADALVGPTLAFDVGWGWVAGQIGPTWRGEARANAPGFGAVLAGGWIVPHTVRVRAQAQVRRFVPSDLPVFLAEVDAAAAFPVRATTLTIASGASLTGHGTSRIAGMPDPGSVLARAQLGVETPLHGPLTWHLELGAERGARTVDYVRGRVFTGFAVRFGAITPSGAAAHPPGDVTFRLDAPHASDVSIAGAFTGWEPQPMSRTAEGSWWITVRLAPGEYEYVYVVDGAPVPPPESAIRRPDGYGGGNGVILVAPAPAGR